MARKTRSEITIDKVLDDIAEAQPRLRDLRRQLHEARKGHLPPEHFREAWDSDEREQAQARQTHIDALEHEIARLEGELLKAWKVAAGLQDSPERLLGDDAGDRGAGRGARAAAAPARSTAGPLQGGPPRPARRRTRVPSRAHRRAARLTTRRGRGGRADPAMACARPVARRGVALGARGSARRRVRGGRHVHRGRRNSQPSRDRPSGGGRNSRFGPRNGDSRRWKRTRREQSSSSRL